MIAWAPYILAILGFLQVVGLGIIGWVLMTLVSHERQIYRLVSDRESEKGTLMRIHSDFEARLRVLEKHHSR